MQAPCSCVSANLRPSKIVLPQIYWAPSSQDDPESGDQIAGKIRVVQSTR